MEIAADRVKELRVKTGAGIMDCKEALKVSNGNFDKAVDFLREKGLSAATKKSSRATKDGLITSYIHMGGKVGVMIEVNCETDFVAKTENFKNLTRDLAMHVAAMNPLYVKPEDVPEATLQREKDIYRKQVIAEGKPEKIADKIVEGKLKKFYEEVCLVKQKFIRDTNMTVEDLIKASIAATGENILVKRFVRYQLGGDEAADNAL
ncbi:MAG TPA: translation elongation factor Ts [Syntrophales bacterium]|nr:translation elongation factor Ts [Syntrophobacterales bacterium]HNU85532.1 translation elongation factor Ts [Syntrophales bacterium]HNZ35671.1 translation elongation factor Ts [Syntrophales bacterium]HOF73817.1 translation elongation factor Ts [Syntrophales bacterium]HOH45142.1 translation elongation factor Ts [Syntrophales bacterium]